MQSGTQALTNVALPLQHRLQAVVVPAPDLSAWMGGHGTDPYEQNTQQSPALGFNSTLHPWHSKK
jgi:hypothetical protein